MHEEIYEIKNGLHYYILKYFGVIVILILWQVLPEIGILDSQFIPSLSEVLVQLYEMCLESELLVHVAVSLWRVLIGLIIAAVIAIPLGFLLGGWLTRAADILDPLFRIFSQVNPFSLMPVFILFFGIGEAAKLAVVAWVCLWPVLYNTISGVRRVDPILIKTALSMNVSKSEMLKKVIVPGAAPSIFLGLRIGVEMSFFMLIAAEMIGATAGVGWLFHNSAMNNQIPRMYAAGVCIIVLGIILNRFLIYIQNKLFFWKDSTHVFSFARWKKSVTRFNKMQVVSIVSIIVVVIGIGSYATHISKVTDIDSDTQMNHMKMDEDKHMNMKTDDNMKMDEDKHTDMKTDDHMNMDK
ncbi:Putative aliphatic sulfonates transport permease protein SsuC [Clostridiaceae bacterium BL-3]|nr:Putative aliphatic sulfonates transport permease protein SsuC [Clostridiaceae bacterium BL-3]